LYKNICICVYCVIFHKLLQPNFVVVIDSNRLGGKMELWDILDENGNRTGRYVERGKPMKPGRVLNV
jgi:hypothetical protein